MLYPASICSAATDEETKIENSNYVKSINKKYEVGTSLNILLNHMIFLSFSKLLF